MGPDVIAGLATVGVLVVLTMGGFALFARFYRKVDQGKALVVSRMSGDPGVTFSGALVLPVIHRAEEMDISVKTIEIDRRGDEGLICQDNIRADIKVTFFVRVNKTADDVLKVAQSLGVQRASDQHAVELLFTAKFSEALKTVGKRLDFEDLYKERETFRDDIVRVIGQDLNGYVLEDAAIDYLEQTPIEHLDKSDVLDAQGIHKITMLTAAQHVLTNKYEQQERKEITRQNVEADQAILELERQRAEATARQAREIAVMEAKEQAETLKTQAEERKRAEIARLATDEELAVAEENKLRQVAVAEWNKQRTIQVEAERVAKDRGLEAVIREREVELSRISKEKALEAERKLIADLISNRISVEKRVAQEEEGILTLRALAAATRAKDVVCIGAEAEAQEKLVKDIKGAEAAEEVAKYAARTLLLEADATLEAADRDARAQIRTAEGTKAAQAAPGLAEVEVKEAMANAIEKEGRAKARVTLEQMQAEAAGEEKRGLALALTTKEKMLAHATGSREQGLAEALVAIEKAAALEKHGLAEALTTREKLIAEANGLAEKADAMQRLQGVAREHEEFRIRLEKDKEVELARIETQRHVAEAQARTLAKAFENAKMNIVGGDGEFFDRFVKAVGMGQTIDGFVDNSVTAQKVMAEYLEGDASLPADLKDVLMRPRVTPEAVQSLTLSAALGHLMKGGLDKGKIDALLDKARELGFDPALVAEAEE